MRFPKSGFPIRIIVFDELELTPKHREDQKPSDSVVEPNNVLVFKVVLDKEIILPDMLLY